MSHSLTWKKYYPLSDKNAFICLVDHMGDDNAIVQAARVSYDKDIQEAVERHLKLPKSDRQLIRYLINHSHTTPFEMVEIKFMVQVPMDCWRQWVRHRTASINEYSTRYTEAIDACQVTQPEEWRLQSTDNKQGSSGFLGEKDWPEDFDFEDYNMQPFSDARNYLSNEEATFHKQARALYEERLRFGIAKEQARKDLPLSTYTRAYWKCDLHNIFNFLRLRMDSHAQIEIRSFASCMFEIVKQLCPVACEAFEDYVLHGKRLSRMEMEVLKYVLRQQTGQLPESLSNGGAKLASMTDREWKAFLEKL